MKATTNDQIPWRMDWAPSDGPTTSSCTMRTGAFIRPDFRVLARSLVSSTVKEPLICELPPVISSSTFGALYTRSSSTMATGLPIFFLVRLAHSRAPVSFICMVTTGRPLKLSKSSLADSITSPSRGARPLVPVMRRQ